MTKLPHIMILSTLAYFPLQSLQAETVPAANVVREIPQVQSDKVKPESKEQITLSFAPVVKEVAPSVVNVYSRRLNISDSKVDSPFSNDPFYKRFLKKNDPHKAPNKSLGSGVIVSPDGIIITNYHVIEPGDEIRVVLHDKREYFGKLILVDHQTDLAALKIDVGEEQLPFLTLEADEDLEVGDLVLAIGNPFGVGQTVTSGIISALSRSQKGISNLRAFIQTDASINPGNSGGALVTTDGRLIGINTAIYSKSGGSVGIGFAIPSILAQPVLESAKEGGPVQRPWVGVKLHPVTMVAAEKLGLSHPNGAIVRAVYPKSPGDKAGLRVGDLVTAINGEIIDDEADFEFEIAVLPLGSEAELTVLRQGKTIKLPVNLRAPLTDNASKSQIMKTTSPLQGASMRTLDPGLALSLGLDPYQQGVVIVDLPSNAPAKKLRFLEGDVIFKVNNLSVTSLNSLQKALSKRQKSWNIALRRGDKIITVKVHEKSNRKT